MIAAYRAHLTLAGYRPSTLRSKLYVLTAFSQQIAPRELEDANRFDVEEFLSRSLKPESRRAYRSALRSFYMWAHDEGLVEADPTAKLPSIRVPKASPRPIGDAELSLALQRADPRMRAWLLLMALAGLRCIEIAGLLPIDVIESDNGQRLLYLRETKGGGTATVPCHPMILEALAMLPIRNGTWWDCSRVTVSSQVARYLRSVGVDATAHRLRHYAGTAWYRASGHDLLTTATLLRHVNVATTQIYAATDPTRPAEVVSLVPRPHSRLVDLN
jgi:integrase